jgi:hypothetical protein
MTDGPHPSTITVDTLVALIALVVSILSFTYSFYFWRRSFRPIVTAAVRTHKGGNVLIVYNLVLLNSGMIPAKNITIKPDQSSLDLAFGEDATPANKTRWLAAFDEANGISILQNGAQISCGFGTTGIGDAGFWKYDSKISVVIEYEGWFGKKYKQPQELQIIDSESFTAYKWG